MTSIATENPAVSAPIPLLYAARALRGFGDGFAIIILPAYMTALGLDAVAVGLVATASLLGTAVLTLAIGWIAPRFDLRALLLFGAGLMIATGIAFPNVEHLALIALVGFIGTVNPSGGDLGVAVPLEHAVLARNAPDDRRTAVFARYSLIGALCAAAGSLAASLPDFLVAAGSSQLGAFRVMFYAYAALGVICALLYRRVPHARGEERAPHAPLGPSRRTVYKLAALFAVDAFAGGFVAQSLLVLWLFQRFDLSLSAAAVFFFWASTLSALLLSGRGLDRQAHWARQHHGVHAHPLQHLSDPGGIRTQSLCRAGVAAAALGAVADGCADPHLLRHGRGDAGGAAGGRQRHRRAAQPCLQHQPGDCWRAADDEFFRTAAGRLRRSQDCVRSRAAILVPAYQATGGNRRIVGPRERM